MGVFLLILSLTTLDWTQSGLFAKDFAFFHTFSSEPGPGVTQAYFGWLAVTGFISITVIAIIARLDTPVTTVMRAVGAVFGVTMAVLTFWAFAASNSVHDVLKYSAAGFWTAIIGFLFIGTAAAL